MTLAAMTTSCDSTLRHSKELDVGTENKAQTAFCCALLIGLRYQDMKANEGDFVILRPNKKPRLTGAFVTNNYKS